MTDARRAIPSLERLLSHEALEPLLAREPRERVTNVLRAIQDELRAGTTDLVPSDAAWYANEVAARIARANEHSLRAVINASGVVLHTNLGRAPLAQAAIDAIASVSAGYSNLEYDMARGARGSRYDHCTELLCALTGAEAALVVNNNAAALVLALNTVALGRNVVISRGELVEIGDSFRIAEIIERSGAHVHEVGATNRTHLRDYENALPQAAAILKVHRSNYRITGFVSDVDSSDLARIARGSDVPLIDDLGSGLLQDLDDLGLPHERTAREALQLGADIVTMSGDKLLGGPQAGIIVGRAALIERMKRNPLCRALRVDKLTIAALEATLQCYARGTARTDIPILRMIAATEAALRERAEAVARELRKQGVDCEIVAGASTIGGGAYPGTELATSLIRLEGNAASLETALRGGSPAVIARVAENGVLIDLRTVLPEQEEVLISRIADAAR